MSRAAQYNATCRRTDCHWIDLPGGGVMLTQSREWTEGHTRDLERKSEQDRRDWQHRRPLENT